MPALQALIQQESILQGSDLIAVPRDGLTALSAPDHSLNWFMIEKRALQLHLSGLRFFCDHDGGSPIFQLSTPVSATTPRNEPPARRLQLCIVVNRLGQGATRLSDLTRTIVVVQDPSHRVLQVRKIRSNRNIMRPGDQSVVIPLSEAVLRLDFYDARGGQ